MKNLPISIIDDRTVISVTTMNPLLIYVDHFNFAFKVSSVIYSNIGL